MKKVAALLIILGSGLAAYGISGFEGEFSTAPSFQIGQEGEMSGSMGWSENKQIEITAGITLLVCGVMLRIDSK